MATNPKSLGAELLNLQELEELYGNIRGSGGPHVGMTNAPMPPESMVPDEVAAGASQDTGTNAVARDEGNGGRQAIHVESHEPGLATRVASSEGRSELMEEDTVTPPTSPGTSMRSPVMQ